MIAIACDLFDLVVFTELKCLQVKCIIEPYCYTYCVDMLRTNIPLTFIYLS